MSFVVREQFLMMMSSDFLDILNGGYCVINEYQIYHAVHGAVISR